MLAQWNITENWTNGFNDYWHFVLSFIFCFNFVSIYLSEYLRVTLIRLVLLLSSHTSFNYSFATLIRSNFSSIKPILINTTFLLLKLFCVVYMHTERTEHKKGVWLSERVKWECVPFRLSCHDSWNNNEIKLDWNTSAVHCFQPPPNQLAQDIFVPLWSAKKSHLLMGLQCMATGNFYRVFFSIFQF